ncbi:hypothetical protein BDZ45DRAFT_803352 [Acephala macrosclerotiorum]|nr:hypothetical protein BDZ45DRAFT_803352 [Acephala macrosclerotiorum]
MCNPFWPLTEEIIDRQISNLVSLIGRKYLSTSKESRIMDLGEKGQFFTLDVISDLAFHLGTVEGQWCSKQKRAQLTALETSYLQGFLKKEHIAPPQYLEKDCDPFDYIKIMEQYIPAMLVMANLPWLVRLTHTRLFASAFPKESDKLGFGAFIGIANNIVKQRFLPGADIQKDMMAFFIRHGLTHEEASSEALLQIVAGSDTSAATIRVLLLNLMSPPPCYRRLAAEIDTASRTGKISSPIKDSEQDRCHTCKQ